MFDVNYDEVKKLISILEESALSVLELQTADGQKIHLEKPLQNVSAVVAAPAPAVQSTTSVEAEALAPAKDAVGKKSIKAPIVGVFYTSPSPESEPFAPVGKKVKKGDTVCIIEAMKCMNEIQAEESGEITEVLVSNGDLVEYGQPLFTIV